jgi:hypothetical protein
VADPQRSAPSVIAIVIAIVGFFTGPVLGFFLALGAIVLGVIGFLIAASPRRRGGAISLASIGLGAIGIVYNVVRGALALIF